jgi:hypothetical protein
MKTTKRLIGVFVLVVFWGSTAYIEYRLVHILGIASSLFGGVSGSILLLKALSSAPEGYEDKDGFHVCTRRRRINRARRIAAPAIHSVH